MTISERIREARDRKGWTQVELAAECGWATGSRISNYERNGRNVTVENLYRLADALDVDLVWLTFGLETPATLSTEEQVLLTMWRAMDDDDKPEFLQQLMAWKSSPQPAPARPPPVLRVVPKRRKEDR